MLKNGGDKMKAFKILTIVILSIISILISGCSIVEQNAQLKAENRALRKKLDKVERENMRLRLYEPESKEFSVNSTVKKQKKPSSVSNKSLVISKEDLLAMSRRRADNELKELNNRILGLNQMAGNTGIDTLQYAQTYQQYTNRLETIRTGQPFYEEVIVPGLIAAPLKPSKEGMDALAAYEAEQAKLAAELAAREAELKTQREAAEAQRQSAENAEKAASGAAEAAEGARNAAESAAKAADKAAEAAERPIIIQNQ